ncbi:hypothetical protein Tamer19_48890 [Cupriavidus sp. TA19]|nr:hypothetical protein Tamer19_48890 [Cupriavidus sp. TA19]
MLGRPPWGDTQKSVARDETVGVQLRGVRANASTTTTAKGARFRGEIVIPSLTFQIQ